MKVMDQLGHASVINNEYCGNTKYMKKPQLFHQNMHIVYFISIWHCFTAMVTSLCMGKGYQLLKLFHPSRYRWQQWCMVWLEQYSSRAALYCSVYQLGSGGGGGGGNGGYRASHWRGHWARDAAIRYDSSRSTTPSSSSSEGFSNPTENTHFQHTPLPQPPPGPWILNCWRAEPSLGAGLL